MATRKTKTRAKVRKSAADNQLAQAVAQSAQKIWLAGLGAFARARTEGDKLFDLLVEQGKTIRTKSGKAADQAMKSVRTQADATLSTAQGKWDKLEQVFEDRVSRSLQRLGVLTSREVGDLSRQVEELNRTVRELLRASAAKGSPARKAKARAKPRMRKGAAKKRASRG